MLYAIKYDIKLLFMFALKLPKPKPLFEVEPALLDAISDAAPLNKVSYLPFEDIHDPIEYVYRMRTNQALYDVATPLAELYSARVKAFKKKPIALVLRKLAAGPGDPIVVSDPDSDRGWHTDLGVYVSVVDEVTTEYLVGKVDRVKAAEDLGEMMLIDAVPGTNFHQEQVAALNHYDDYTQIPGDIRIITFDPYMAVLSNGAHAHRRPPMNPHEHPITRTFVNSSTI